MGTLFIEYKILSQYRKAYLEWIGEKRRELGFELLEGSSQPGLFVELWRDMTLEMAGEWETRRLDVNNPDWAFLHGCLDGGTAKLHIWHFDKVE
jgi:hypothetical protein